MSKKPDIPSKEEVAATVALHVCSRRCFGREGDAAGCCRLDGRNYILGPIRDHAALLSRLEAKFGRKFDYDDVFVDYDEGKTMFADRECWQTEACYPALRVDLNSPRHDCQFLGQDQLCTIHDIRSITCQNHYCGHLKTILDAL